MDGAFDTDPDWPTDLSDAVIAYRAAWRAKLDEINACITDNADQEELVDQPVAKRGVVRVSGPFTVEGIQPPEVSLGNMIETAIGGEPQEIEDTFVGGPADIAAADGDSEAKNVEAYLDQMMRLLKIDGVRFPDNKQMAFTRLDPTGVGPMPFMPRADGFRSVKRTTTGKGAQPSPWLSVPSTGR